ncbi:hypothetical protein BJY52DRAFT_1232521, partial [Lactarius psammicola]
MGDSVFVSLQCVFVNGYIIDGHPFEVDVPCGSICGGIVGYVVKLNPSLQVIDHKRFSLYKPPSSHSIPVSYKLNRRELADEHFDDPLLPSHSVKERFQEKFQENDGDRHHNVDVLVCVDYGGKAGTSSSALHPLFEPSRTDLLRYVTLKLKAETELRLPTADVLKNNGLVEQPAGEAPDFIKQLEAELCHQRSAIGFHGGEAHILDALKSFLGESFGKYFTDSSDGPEMYHVSGLELIHYVVALSDSHLCNKVAYKAKPEPHIYSLLGRFTEPPPSQPDAGLQWWATILVPTSSSDSLHSGTGWSFGLAVEVDDLLYKYMPRSDFFMDIKGFPHLIAEVVSDRSGGKDKNRMLLQASCLVRLGNALLTEKHPEFVMKAIYFDREFQAREYTLYQRGSEPDNK